MTGCAGEIFETHPWTTGIVGGVVGWLMVHPMIERRRKHDDDS